MHFLMGVYSQDHLLGVALVLVAPGRRGMLGIVVCLPNGMERMAA